MLLSCVLDSFDSISFSHIYVRRDGNYVAYHLARIFPFRVEQTWENHYIWDDAPYVLMDTLSLE